MRKLLKRLSALAVVGGVVAAGFIGVAAPASATEGGVTVVQSKSEAPEGTVWTPGTPDPATCMVTDTGVHTQEGKHHEAETELRYAYKQVIPGQTEASHQEYKYSRTVADYKTQYFFAKFTHTKTRTWIKGTPATPSVWAVFSPNKDQGPFDGPPAYPSDPRGTWQVKGQVPPGHAGPNGVYQTNDNGRANWFYREAGNPGTPGKWSAWSDYGPWTLWQPIQHTSWQDSNVPLGTPQFHGQGDTWYREWQAQPTGETRQVQTGTHVDTTDWLTAPPVGEGWTQVDERKVVDREKTDESTVYYNPAGEPTETFTDANYTTGNPGSPWVKVDEKRFETKAEYTEPDVVTNYSHTYKSPDCTVPPTPANPQASIEAVCGAADITLTNPVTGEDGQITASFVVFVDGDFYQAYAVEGDKSESVRLTFDEDTGDHTVEVFQAGTSEWKSIAKETVPSDCIPPKPDNKIVFGDWKTGEFECGDTTVQITRTVTSTEYVLEGGEWVEGESVTTTQTETRALTDEEIASLECETGQPPVVTPPTSKPAATPAPAPETGDTLATTGADTGSIIGFSLLGFGLIAGAAALIASARRKARSLPVKSEEE